MSDNTSVVTSKGQVTIPSKFRKKFNIEQGIRVIFLETDEGILMKPVISEIRKLKGFLKNKVNIDRLEAELTELRAEWRLNDVKR